MREEFERELREHVVTRKVLKRLREAILRCAEDGMIVATGDNANELWASMFEAGAILKYFARERLMNEFDTEFDTEFERELRAHIAAQRYAARLGEEILGNSVRDTLERVENRHLIMLAHSDPLTEPTVRVLVTLLANRLAQAEKALREAREAAEKLAASKFTG